MIQRRRGIITRMLAHVSRRSCITQTAMPKTEQCDNDDRGAHDRQDPPRQEHVGNSAQIGLHLDALLVKIEDWVG